MNRSLAFLFGIMVLVCAVYRFIPYDFRPEWLGAPQIAMAIFAGSIIKDRKWAFAIPLFSMLLSDLLMQAMHMANPSMMPGFYKGQLMNYVLILSTTVIGFFISQNRPGQILAGAFAAPLVYFLLSNTTVWISGGGYFRPKTFDGFLMTMVDGLPFLKSSLSGTVFFSAVFFSISSLVYKGKNILSKA